MVRSFSRDAVHGWSRGMSTDPVRSVSLSSSSQGACNSCLTPPVPDKEMRVTIRAMAGSPSVAQERRWQVWNTLQGLQVCPDVGLSPFG